MSPLLSNSDGSNLNHLAEVYGFPRVASRLVPQPSLLERLDRLSPLSVIEALPGFGKTTLAAAWGRRQVEKGAHVVWVQVPAETSSTSSLHDILHQSLRRSQIALGTSATSTRRDGLPAWVSDLAHTDRPIIIVLDEAQTLPPSLAAALCEIVAAAPSVHLLVCCTPDHAFHAAAARYKAVSNVITGADLELQAHQIPEYAEAWGHTLSFERAQALHALVGGWLAPLQLVLDATPHTADTFGTIIAREYVLDQVLDQVSEPLAQAIARVAVPEQVDRELADRLLGSRGEPGVTGPEHLTSYLQRLGLLWPVPREDQGVQWRFPPLLRRVLVDTLEADDPATARRCHRETARNLVDHGGIPVDTLLRHARIGRDWALLAALWAESGWSLIGSPEFEFAYENAPRAATKNHPGLALAGAVARGMATTHSEAWVPRTEVSFHHYVDAAQQELQRSSTAHGSAERAELLVACMIGARSTGRLKEATNLATEAFREHRQAHTETHGDQRNVQTAWLRLQIGITQWLNGDQPAALEHATNSYESAPDTIVGAGAAGLLAAIHATAGDPASSRRWISSHDAVDLSGHWAAGLAHLPAALAKAMLALDQLDKGAAEEALADAPLGYDGSGLWPLVLFVHTRYALVFGDPAATLSRVNHVGTMFERHLRHNRGIIRQMFDRCTSDLMLALGQLNRAQQRLVARREDAPWLCVPTARFHLMTGDPGQAIRMAESNLWRSGVSGRDRAHLCVLKAIALQEKGHHKRASAAFQQASSFIEHVGDLEPCLSLPIAQRRKLLGGLKLFGTEPARSRLARARQPYPDDAQFVTISPREQEIVMQMHRHDTANDIARELSVSVNTVRKQLVAIYAKLGVHDRSAAIMRARGLGILDELDELDDEPCPV